MDKTLNSSGLAALFNQGTKLVVKKNNLVQDSEGNLVINYIQTGYVKRYIIANDGSSKVQSIYAPGYVFPLTLVFKSLLDIDIYEGKEVLFYKALTDVTLFSISQTRLHDAVAANPLLYKELLYEAGLRFHSNIQWLENSALNSSYKRLAHMLLYLSTTFGTPTPQETKLLIPLTHQDLADILGMARETVSRHMAVLIKVGAIKAAKGTIVVDANKLDAELSA